MHTCMSPHNAQVKEMEGNVLIEVPVHVRMMGEMPLVLEESVYFVHIVPWWLFEMSVCCTIRVPLLYPDVQRRYFTGMGSVLSAFQSR